LSTNQLNSPTNSGGTQAGKEGKAKKRIIKAKVRHGSMEMQIPSKKAVTSPVSKILHRGTDQSTQKAKLFKS